MAILDRLDDAAGVTGWAVAESSWQEAQSVRPVARSKLAWMTEGAWHRRHTCPLVRCWVFTWGARGGAA